MVQPVWQQRRDRVPSIGFTSAIVLSSLTLQPALQSYAAMVQAKATATARTQQRQEQVRQVNPENYDLKRYPVTPQHEAHWQNLLWTTAVVRPREPFVADALVEILGMMALPKLTDSQKRTIVPSYKGKY